MNYWLMKTEPSEFSIHDLQRVGTEPWGGVRNYQARNFMRDDMSVGDLAFLYHSKANPTGIAGIMKVSSETYPDPSQFHPESAYYDPKATPEKPRWFLVEVSFVQTFKKVLPLSELKDMSELEDCPLTQKGNRLSVMPLQPKHWQAITNVAIHKRIMTQL